MIISETTLKFHVETLPQAVASVCKHRIVIIGCGNSQAKFAAGAEFWQQGCYFEGNIIC